MNYLKRIEIKQRPQHFQQGGNIAIGSPKPYTTTLPGVNFNPLTLNNAPIEINTTGISDQIQKMQQLAYDREVLAFKYKDLEYKEGKDYLDFMGEIAKSINGISGTVKSAGGIAAISPRFKDILAQQESEKQKIFQDIGRATSVKDFKTSEALIAKIGELHSNPKYLEAQTLSSAIDEMFDKANDYGIGTKTIMDQGIRYIQGDPNVDIYKLLADAKRFKALKLSAKDETSFIKNFMEPVYLKASEKQVVSIDQNTGIKKTTTIKERPDLTKVKAALKSNLINMQEGKAYLEVRNINPDNPNSADLDAFVNTIVDAYDATQEANFAPKIEEGVIDKLLPSYDDTPAGKASGSGKNKSEATEDAEDFLTRINDEYGYDAKKKMENIIRSVIKDAQPGEKWARVEKKLIEDGFQRLDGKTPTGVEEEYKGKTAGIVPKDITNDEIVSILNSAYAKTNINETVIANKGGKKYLITDNPKVKAKIMELWPKTKIHKENEDDDVVWKDYGIDPGRWNLMEDEGNTTIFELEDAPKKTSSSYKGSNVDPKEAAKQLNSTKSPVADSTVLSKYYDLKK